MAVASAERLMTEAQNSSTASTAQPFRRARVDSHSQLSSALFSAETAKTNLLRTLKNIGYTEVENKETLESVINGGALEQLSNYWRKRDSHSEIAFQGLLSVLEYCLQHSVESNVYFEKFIDALGYHTVQFWRAAVPYVFDSDMSHGTKYRDALLFSLTLYDVNTGKSRLKELYAAVPGIQKSLLGVHAKRFGEQYHHLQHRRSCSSRGGSLRGSTDSLNGADSSLASDDEEEVPRRGKRHSLSLDPHSSEFAVGDDGTIFTSGGLAHTHFQQRVINVSNAPPVTLRREKSGEWEIKQGSGGLVSCVDPVMSVNQENMWLANLGMNIDKKKLRSTEFLNSAEDSHQLAPATNTLGLPLMRQALADVLFHVIADDDIKEENEEEKRRIVREEMSLLGVLNNYNKGNYKLNPVIVQEQDYNVYYGGISNGLLWPALHNLSEYIVSDYDDPKVLYEHWCAYVRVNYQFAIDAVRNSRPQDFIWIHDYHLMLTGMIMQSLDPTLETIGFFLHIPFLPPDDFFDKYRICAFPILRGLLRFSKVGFQTHRDRAKFVELIGIHFPTARITYDSNLDINFVTYQGWSCSLGVFPVSIKNEDFLKVARAPETIKKAQDIRQTIMGDKPVDGARLFFSVERFDYTKGIKEKLVAYRHYFQRHPDRIGKDILLQVAVTNRRSVDTYRMYQDDCIQMAEDINKEFSSSEYPNWKPLIFRTDGLQRGDLIAHYLAMDVGVVTPKKDGMNLVAKEMLVCNPSAGLVLSTGAGSEIQFTMAGLHDDEDPTYHRVADIYNAEEYADTFFAAAIEAEEVRVSHGQRLHEFLLNNDIEKWSTSYLDPGWSHLVIRQNEVKCLDEFYSLMMRTRDVRRQIVEAVLKGIPIKNHFAISLKNAHESLLQSCEHNTNIIHLRSVVDESESAVTAHLNIANELGELKKDLSFLDFIRSNDVYNVEQFLSTLQEYHPISAEKFREECQQLGDLFTDADHFSFVFTDRDGTLKSYSCSYPASIQPAYSGVIQAQFARRCAQTCAIITTAPLMRIGVLDVNTIPEGYYYIGASAGREWFIDPSKKFKDHSIPEQDLELLDRVFSSISDLLEKPTYRHFRWVGSGLQKHYGHITIAHQDAVKSVPQQQVAAIDTQIRQIVEAIDRQQETLKVVLTDTDIKVFLKSESGGIFDKGHGLRLLCDQMKLELSDGAILVCGDSATDLPMLEVCLSASPQGVSTVWVTTDEALRQTVKELCGKHDNNNYVFVSCPEVLLGGMAQATIRETSISRPRFTHDSE